MESFARESGVSLKELDNWTKTPRASVASLLCCLCPPKRTFFAHRDGCCGAFDGRSFEHNIYDMGPAMMEWAAFKVGLAVEQFMVAGMTGGKAIYADAGA